MEMVAEGVLSPSKHLGQCDVSPTFTAIVEGKESKEVHNQTMLCILQRNWFTNCYF